jgi:hypothetical protein
MSALNLKVKKSKLKSQGMKSPAKKNEVSKELNNNGQGVTTLQMMQSFRLQK